MRKLIVLLSVAVLLPAMGALSGSAADAGHKHVKHKKAVKTLTVAALASALKSKARPVVFDANTPRTRKSIGVIPGAKNDQEPGGERLVASLGKRQTTRVLLLQRVLRRFPQRSEQGYRRWL